MFEALIPQLQLALQSGINAVPSALSSPSSRLFWPLLLTPCLFIVVLSGWRFGLHIARVQLAHYLAPTQFFTLSSVKDLSLLLTNAALKVGVVIPLFGSKLAVAMAIALFLQQSLGDSPTVGLAMPSVVVVALFSLLFFIVEDASRFGLHVLMHKVPVLWQLHKVHHSAPQLTPLTLHRVHPLEMTLYYLRSILVFGLLAGGFTWATQSPANVWAFLGVDALGLIFNACAANLRHSGIYLSFGWLERVFISPAQHQIHHSSAPEHHDKNFGTCLSLWDRCANSWLSSDKRPDNPLVFGLYSDTIQR